MTMQQVSENAGGGDESAVEFWPRILKLHEAPGVAAACLRLQDTCRLDIAFFLAVLCGAADGRALDIAALQRLESLCAAWRKSVVEPLFRIRTEMKRDAILNWHTTVPALREAIKARELKAERIEIEVLEVHIRKLPKAAAFAGDQRIAEAAMLCLDLKAPERTDRLPLDARHICDALARLG